MIGKSNICFPIPKVDPGPPKYDINNGLRFIGSVANPLRPGVEKVLFNIFSLYKPYNLLSKISCVDFTLTLYKALLVEYAPVHLIYHLACLNDLQYLLYLLAL